MENNRNFYSTYKFYDEQGRRLAVFGELVNTADQDNVMRVTVITCSKSNEFQKKKAVEGYLTGQITFIEKCKKEKSGDRNSYRKKMELVHPQEFFVELGEDNIKYALVKFCRDKFYTRGLHIKVSFEEKSFLYNKKRGELIY